MELYVSVEALKAHLNVDYDNDDDYLESLSATAQASIEKYIQRPLSDCEKGGELNPMLIHAIKILAGGFYANREPVAYANAQPLPYTLDYLVRPFIKYT
ncbi:MULTISPECIES: head-tail connector protein [Bacteroides]|uniref:Phage gp6-like head-tail connector protein n=1 Tax=Prevotella heparinolytica TaxID=28113 RepID=A0A449I4K0_9BACE|nr:head-tail connector protein [Bacteroides heparinolyticus]VFB14378.1 Phage gp6-like head-tail connector protein [Bacteroides heparinolyticus]